MRRSLVCFICLILCLCLCLSPVMASTQYTGHYTSISINDSYFFDKTGNYIVVDDIEFINYVLQAMQLNVTWVDQTNIVPYSVNRIQFNNSLSQTYSGITVRYQSFKASNAISGYIYVNGMQYDAAQTNHFPLNGTDLFFDYSIGYNDANSIHFDFQGTRIDNSVYMIVCDSGDNDILDSVLDSLMSIQTSLSNIQAIDQTSSNRLLQIVTATQAAATDLSSISTTLNTISLNLNSISNYCSSILTASNETNTILEDTQDYFEQYFPTFDNDLLSINSTISDFRINFNTFATNALMALNQIDNTTQHIDSTLDTMLEMQQGTALQDIPVSGSGGSSISLWSLIKNSVTIGLNATKGLFGGLFDLLSMFGQYSSGFNVFHNVGSYSPLSYVPEDYTLLNENMLPDIPFGSYWSTNYKFNIEVNGDTVVCKYFEGGTGTYSRNVCQVTLDPGSYMLYATNDERIKLSMRTLNNVTYGSFVTTINYPFTVQDQISLYINVSINPPPVSPDFVHGFHLKLVKTG